MSTLFDTPNMLAMKKAVAALLLILAVVMFYLSYTIGAWPPGVTGIGFVAIALVFFAEN